MNAGIEIFERQTVILHAKTLLIDDCITVIGSTNLDYRSIEYNCELSAVVRSESFGAGVRMLFDHDVRFSQRIHPAVWRRRPLSDRVTQWAVNRTRYLL